MFNTGPHFESKPHSASLRFPKGLGLIVEQEIKQLLATSYTPLKFTPEIKASSNSVEITNASLRTLSELCMRVTVAKDIILNLGTAKLQYEHEIQKIVKKIAWDKILPQGAELALRVSTSKSRLYHSGLVEASFKKALKTYGFSFGKKNHSFTALNITLKENIVSLGLSISGRSLNYREYREELSHKAPLNECLAAACVFIADNISTDDFSNKDIELHIPFAGSGTFGFEALLHYLNIAPCLFRKEYAVETLPFSSPSSITNTRKKAKAAIKTNQINLHLSDNNEQTIKNLKSYTKSFTDKLELDNFTIDIKNQDFFSNDFKISTDKNICILLNPPYGERLKSSEKFFIKLGQKLKSRYGKHSSAVWGVCLVPAGNSAETFRKNLNASSYNSVKLSNGGLAIEAIAFLL